MGSLGSLDRFGDLPSELLGQIFGHFAEPQLENLQALDNWKREYRSPWIEHRNALQNLRLVCRRFHDLATPLLFTYLSISVDNGSLKLADTISRQPRLAACIRGVVFHSGFNNREMADDMRLFQDRMVLELCEAMSLLADQAYQAGHAEKGCHHVDIEAVTTNHYRITKAWDVNLGEDYSYLQWPSVTENGDLCNLDTRHQEMPHGHEEERIVKILIDGHKKYREEMARQRWCLVLDDFEKDLAACLTRLPHLETLEMDAQRGPLMDACGLLETNDLDALRRFVAAGHHGPWKGPDGFRDHLLGHVMKRLPGKLHDAGIRLRTLRLGVVPVEAEPAAAYALDDAPTHGCLQGDDALALAAVASTLEHVTVTSYHEPCRYWGGFVESYVRTLLSGSELRTLDLFVPQGAGGSSSGLRATMAHRVGRVLAERSPARLRSLRLTGMTVRAASLATMLAGCSGEARLDGVYLEDGRWADVADEVAAARRGQVRLRSVKGGEMGRILLHEPVTREKEDEYVSMGYGGTEPIVLLMAERYLGGDARVQRNPFREHKDNGAYFRARKNVVVSS